MKYFFNFAIAGQLQYPARGCGAVRHTNNHHEPINKPLSQSRRPLPGPGNLKQLDLMALINCPNCGGTISDKAERCPHCGTPQFPQPEQQQQFDFNSGPNPPRKPRNTGLIIALSLVALIVVGGIVAVVLKVKADKEAVAREQLMEQKRLEAEREQLRLDSIRAEEVRDSIRRNLLTPDLALHMLRGQVKEVRYTSSDRPWPAEGNSVLRFDEMGNWTNAPSKTKRNDGKVTSIDYRTDVLEDEAYLDIEWDGNLPREITITGPESGQTLILRYDANGRCISDYSEGGAEGGCEFKGNTRYIVIESDEMGNWTKMKQSTTFFYSDDFGNRLDTDSYSITYTRTISYYE